MSPTATSLPARRSRALANRLLVLEAAVILLPAALAVRFRPFARVVAARKTVPAPDRSVDPHRLAWAVGIARRKVPWRAMCFESALCLRAMLRRRGVASTLHYGIGSEDAGALKAHVWLSVDGEVLIGGENAAQFACVASFPGEAVD